MAVAIAGLCFRVAYIVVTRNDTHLCGNRLCGDALFYGGQARANSLGTWWRDWTNAGLEAADHPPLTSFYLTPVSSLFDDSIVAQRVAIALLGAGVIVAIGLLARRLGGDRAGLIAAVIAAINANLWMNDVIVMSETLAALAITLTLIAMYRFIDHPRAERAALVGLAIGFAGLARAELLLLGPVTFVPIALLTRSIPVPARFGRMLIAGVVTLGVLSPWMILNLQRFDRPVLLSTNDGITLLGANCDRVYGVDGAGGTGFWNLACATDVDLLGEATSDVATTAGDQSVVAARYREIALDYIADHKRLVPKVAGYRLARGWGVYAPDQMVWLNEGEGRERWASWAGFISWWLLAIPAAVAMFVLRRRRVPVWPLASMVVVVTITLTAFYGIVRFRLPADIAATVLAAIAIDALLNRRRSTPTA